MRSQSLFALVVLVATPVVLFLVTGTYASDSMLMFWKNRLVEESAETSFSITGTYTGNIDGQVELDGKEFWITRGTTIYVVGKGLQEKGIYVANASVLLCGVERKGVSEVKMVVVRPDASTLRENYRKPKVPEKAIPSEVDSHTGTLSAGTPR